MAGLQTLPEPGATVAQTYRVECQLGKSARTLVLGAIHTRTGRRCALRFWLENAAREATATEGFIRRAHAISLFQHLHVAEVFETSQSNGSPFVASEWLDGATLAQRLDTVGNLTWDEARSLLLPCLDALALAHEGGIVHGRIKPSNIFLSRSAYEGERARLIGFDGSAAISLDGATDPEAQAHVAPELCLGEPPSTRSDVYACGVLLYRALCGDLPCGMFDLKDATKLLNQRRPIPLRQRAPHIAASIAAAIERAIDPDQYTRQPSLRELSHELLGIAPPEQRTQRAFRWVKPVAALEADVLHDMAFQPAFEPRKSHTPAGFVAVALAGALAASVTWLTMAGSPSPSGADELLPSSAQRPERELMPRPLTAAAAGETTATETDPLDHRFAARAPAYVVSPPEAVPVAASRPGKAAADKPPVAQDAARAKPAPQPVPVHSESVAQPQSAEPGVSKAVLDMMKLQ